MKTTLIALAFVALASACGEVEPSPFTPNAPREGLFCSVSCMPVSDEAFMAGRNPYVVGELVEVEPLRDCTDFGPTNPRCSYFEVSSCGECNELINDAVMTCEPRVVNPEEGTYAVSRNGNDVPELLTCEE